MDIRQLKYFLATAEAGQVSRAATALCISQSAVTAAIRHLETELGVLLFKRTAAGMQPTQAGRDLVSPAREILAKIEDARNIAKAMSPVSGTVSLAATYTVMGYFLPAHLERLARLFPNIDIRLTELSREGIEHGLLTNRFDIAMLLTSNVTNRDLEVETLFRSTRRLWVSNEHAFNRTGRATFSEIAEEDYVMLTVDEAAHAALRYWSVTGYTPRIRLRTASTEAVRSMVANGRGVTILSDMVYRPWSLEGKRISTISTDIDIPTMNVGLAWRKGRQLPDAASVICSYFRQEYLLPQSPVQQLRG